jgi:voltage-gated potassium channel
VLFDDFELISVTVFTMEYVLRLWVASCDKRYSASFIGPIRLFSPIDLAAILPSLLTGFTTDFRFLWAMRILSCVRIWRLTSRVLFFNAVVDTMGC